MFTDGTDYEEGPYHVIIERGTERAKYCIKIQNDEVLEEDETFNIEIGNATAMAHDVILKNPYVARVTILDDECKHKDGTCLYCIIITISCLIIHVSSYS